jgi:hypothetical protein
MYQQPKRELLEREAKHIPGFPGLMEKVKLEPVIEQPKKTSKASAPAPAPEQAPDAGKKKMGRPKKTVI